MLDLLEDPAAQTSRATLSRLEIMPGRGNVIFLSIVPTPFAAPQAGDA